MFEARSVVNRKTGSSSVKSTGERGKGNKRDRGLGRGEAA